MSSKDAGSLKVERILDRKISTRVKDAQSKITMFSGTLLLHETLTFTRKERERERERESVLVGGLIRAMRFRFNNKDISPSRKFSRSRGIQIWAPEYIKAGSLVERRYLFFEVENQNETSGFYILEKIVKRLMHFRIFEIFSSILYSLRQQCFAVLYSCFTIYFFAIVYTVLYFFIFFTIVTLFYFTITIYTISVLILLLAINSELWTMSNWNYRISNEEITEIEFEELRKEKGETNNCEILINSKTNNFMPISNNEIITRHIEL